MRAMETRRSPFRWHDFVALPEDDRRELVDGRLEALEMPTNWHEFIVAFLIRTIGTSSVWSFASSSLRLAALGLDGPGEPRRDSGPMEHLPQGDPAVWTW